MNLIAPALSVPWWDTVWIGTILVSFGDLLVIVGFGVAWWIYKNQDKASAIQRQKSTLAHLKGVKAAMEEWHDNFFTTSYEGTAAQDRSESDFNMVMRGTYIQNYRVPTEPVSSLIEPAGDIWPYSTETVRAANVALARMTVFNQLVQQQTDFNLRHAAELRRLDEEERKPVALAARRISEDLHGGAIADASWYHELKKALEDNIRLLEAALDQ